MVNLADLVDNFEIFLSQLGTGLLKLGYKNYSTTKEFKVKDSKGVYDVVKIVGEIGQKMGLAPDGSEEMIALPENPQVKVVVNSGLAFTKQGKQETLIKLRSTLDIDRRTLLEEMGGFDPDKVEARLAEERAGQPISENGMDISQPIPQPGVPGQAPQGVPQEGQTMDAGEIAQFIQEKGLQLDEVFQNDPELLKALLEGKIPFDIIDNTIVPVQ